MRTKRQQTRAKKKAAATKKIRNSQTSARGGEQGLTSKTIAKK
jgi:hypothetical protein